MDGCCGSRLLQQGETNDTLDSREVRTPDHVWKRHRPEQTLQLTDEIFLRITVWHTEHTVRGTRNCLVTLARKSERDKSYEVWSVWESCCLVELRGSGDIPCWSLGRSGGASRELGAFCTPIEVVVTVVRWQHGYSYKVLTWLQSLKSSRVANASTNRENIEQICC